MAVQTKGFCKYCGKAYTKSGMLRHLPACRKREIRLLAENDKRICRYFEIVISDKYLTELVIKIHSCRDGEKRNNKILLLSRNNPLKIVCGKCGKNKAQLVNPQAYYYDGSPFWCENCLENDNADDEEYCEAEIFLPICNSPRMGVCI